MSVILPPFPGGWDQVANLSPTDNHLFASTHDSRYAVIPPNWLKQLRNNVSNIWSGTARSNRRKNRTISAEGRLWLNSNARLWPYLDKSQRRDGLAYPRYDLENLTEDQLLEYAVFIDRAFGAGHGGVQQFVEAGKEGFKQEAIRRCREVAHADRHLGEFPEVATFQNVIDYLSSEQMKAAFNKGETSRVFTKMYYCLEALSNESGNDWLHDCVSSYFETHGMLVELGTTTNFPGVDRHSLMCWINQKSGGYIKRKSEAVMKGYDRKLVLKTVVRFNSNKHKELIRSGKYEVVWLQRQHVPSCRVDNPAFYLEILKLDTSPIVRHVLTKAAESAKFGGMPRDEFLKRAALAFDGLLMVPQDKQLDNEIEQLEEDMEDQAPNLQGLDEQQRAGREATRRQAEQEFYAGPEREHQRQAVLDEQRRQNLEANERREAAIAESVRAAEADQHRRDEEEQQAELDMQRRRDEEERQRQAELMEQRRRDEEERRRQAAEAQRAREREAEEERQRQAAEAQRAREREAEEERQRQAAEAQRAREREVEEERQRQAAEVERMREREAEEARHREAEAQRARQRQCEAEEEARRRENQPPIEMTKQSTFFTCGHPKFCKHLWCEDCHSKNQSDGGMCPGYTGRGRHRKLIEDESEVCNCAAQTKYCKLMPVKGSGAGVEGNDLYVKKSYHEKNESDAACYHCRKVFKWLDG